MRFNWAPLRHALSALRTDGAPLRLWWRDDDAIEPGHALDRLADLSGEVGLPVGLAVIPSLAKPGLAEHLSARTELVPMVHGWAHANHASAGSKKAEFGQLRDRAERELGAALDRSRELFGGALLPVFVPPWNRIAPELEARLSPLGYVGISTFGPRTIAPEGLIRLNTHVDPVDWHGRRGLIDPQTLIARIAAILDDRRRGRTDPQEPLGYLTHHLIHDDPLWQFSRALLCELLDGGAQPLDPGHFTGDLE
ncbi:polysaccharide deacetylase family protein [Sulfitobacter sp. LCG007]